MFYLVIKNYLNLNFRSYVQKFPSYKTKHQWSEDVVWSYCVINYKSLYKE